MAAAAAPAVQGRYGQDIANFTEELNTLKNGYNVEVITKKREPNAEELKKPGFKQTIQKIQILVADFTGWTRVETRRCEANLAELETRIGVLKNFSKEYAKELEKLNALEAESEENSQARDEISAGQDKVKGFIEENTNLSSKAAASISTEKASIRELNDFSKLLQGLRPAAKPVEAAPSKGWFW